MKPGILFILFLLMARQPLSAQDSGIQKTFESIIESVVDDLEENEDVDFAPILEDLEYYYENPLNINTATESELKKLHLLNSFQIKQLLDYRYRSGTILSVYELNALEGFGRETLEKIEPFLSFKPEFRPTKAPPMKYARQQLFLRATRVVQEQKGFVGEGNSLPVYEGNPFRYYTRYKFNLGQKTEAGFTAEKDPGEAFFKGSNKQGFDYYSVYFSQNLNSFVKNITVGDFLVRSGQGLVLWQGFASGKSADVLNVDKNPPGASRYHSTDENRFFRGISSGFSFDNFDLTVFVSHKKVDANFESAGEAGLESNFSSLQTSGYHRTESEISDKKSITETSAGAVFTFEKNRLKLGASFLCQNFNHLFIRDDELYNLFRFSGETNANAGLDYFYSAGKYIFFGEAALSKSGGKAFLQGLRANLHDQVALSFLFRHFDKNYHSLTGCAFSESSGNINETGFYSGVVVYPAKHLRLSGYTDFYWFPWLTYSSIAPSKGADVFLQASYSLSNKTRMHLRFKNERKEVKTEESSKYINTEMTTLSLRFNFEYDLSPGFQLKSRLEYSNYRKMGNEKGFMLYQDLIYSSKKWPVNLQFRVAWFNTDSYNTRIYSYENDLLYNYSMPVYYGKGFRFYLNVKYSVSDNLDFWLKLSESLYPGAESVGSGQNEVAGESLTEVKIQCRYNF